MSEATTTVELPRFGPCAFRENEVFSFPWGLPGFPTLRRFLTLTRSGQESVVWLQSLDDLKIALPMVDPFAFFSDYDPTLPAFARLSLDLENPEDFVILVVAIIPEAGDMTVNLLAPVVINLDQRVGRQIVLEGADYSVRTPLPNAIAASPPE